MRELWMLKNHHDDIVRLKRTVTAVRGRWVSFKSHSAQGWAAPKVAGLFD